MKKNLAFVLVLIVLVVSGVSLGTVQAATTADTPYEEDTTQYFESTDPCGYLMGAGATPYPTLDLTNNVSGTIKLRSQGNNVQGCFDENGYAYSSSTSSPTRDSRATYSYTTDHGGNYTDYTVDFVGSSYQVVIDQMTGQWSGYGRITDTSFPGTTAQRWVWFNWDCTHGCPTAPSYWVTTDTTTGAVSGYAYNSYFGFMDFTGLTQELPPKEVYMEVTILSSDGTSEPEDVSPVTAPYTVIADGSDYWRARVQFWDPDINAYLPSTDITSLTITPSATGSIYRNQVENTGVAEIESDINTMVFDPDSETWAYCTTAGSCVLTEDDTDSSTSWNTFFRSYSPTSIDVGLHNTLGDAIDFLGDRDGCRWYYDQWKYVTPRTYQPDCDTIPRTYDIADYFFNRVNDRNQYILDTLEIDVTFANASTTIATDSYTEQDPSDLSVYTYTVHDTAGNPGLPLTWRPRYQLTDFSALFDSTSHDYISSDVTKYSSTNMTLKTTATVADTSEAFFHAFGLSRPGYYVNYQMDVDSSNDSDPQAHDKYLIMDATTAADGIADCTYRTDTMAKNYGASGVSYVTNYVMKYGQKSATTCNGSTLASTNTITGNPTAEQWVCDKGQSDVDGYSTLPYSCYFTGYMPRLDDHVDYGDDHAESMLVIGAINSVIDQEGFINNDSTLTVVGFGADNGKLRNKMYAQIVRNTLGQTASTAQAHLDSDMEDSSGVMLDEGRWFYTEGDIIIDGSSSFTDRTIVTVGGNVFINGDITGGRLGIIALQNSDGLGGYAFLHPDVNEAYANLFLDGALMSFDGVSAPTNWASEEVYIETLLKQFYLNGSLVSNNGVHTAWDLTASSWAAGDGTETSDYELARSVDLDRLRQYRRCYDTLADGTLDTSTIIDCDEGELPRTEYGEANGLYNSFILDYSPADELPIFRLENGR